MAEDIYRELILDHYKHPSNFGHLALRNGKARDQNSNCGDSVDFEVLVKGGKLVDVAFTGIGCAICIASASLLSEAVKGRSLQEVMALGETDVLANLGVKELTPERMKCAMLPLKVLKMALIDSRAALPEQA
ncbi:MAG: iron-sulfur cluster assembly scaffold protein [Thermoprotei archaeon]|nr:iron-sulfur cluster assembly scaffold protein [TACK group archaeon]